MRCTACGREVPDGVYCTRCGADQDTTGGPGDPRRRRGRFAANPDEHVAQPGVITTLLPHLDHDEVNEFRWALIAGIAVLVLLYATGFITAALLVAAFLVPVLYLIYLYEVRVYRDAPAPVLGFTLGGGIVLGLVVTLIAGALLGSLPAVQSTPLGARINLGVLLLGVVLIPVVQEALKPLPALLLRGRAEFSETIDGLVFGVAAGLGFALGQTVIAFSQVLTSLDVRTDPANWLFPLLGAAVLQPLLHGSSTGAITAAIWRWGGQHRGALEIGAVVVAVMAQIAFGLGGQLILAAGLGLPVMLLWQGLVVGGLLIYVRFLLHEALMDEAANLGFARTVCPSCHQHITAAGFCPACGMALTAVADPVRRSRETLPEGTTEGAG